MDNSNDIETLMGYLGDFGKYQFWQFCLQLLSAMTAAVNMLSLVTVGAVPDHRCAIPTIDDDLGTRNFSITNLDRYIPVLETLKYDSCSMYDVNSSDNVTIKCNDWVYDTTFHKSSRGMDWHFVCDRRWMGATAQSAYMFGVFFGSLTLGAAADKYGRKNVFCGSAVLQVVFGVAAAYVTEFYAFLIVQFFYGIFGSAGSYIPGFVLAMELIGPSRRTVCGISFQAAFSFGFMLVAGWGAIIPDRQLLQLVYGLHGVVLLGHWWLMDESPRWLWANGKVNEAVKIVQKALKVNGSAITVDASQFVSKATVRRHEKEVNVGVTDLFKTPILRKRTLNVCFSWFANSLVYYGLSLGTGKLYGNPYLVLFLAGCVELPGYVVTILLMDRTGRRSLVSFFMISGGICCCVAAYLFQGGTTRTLLVMLGKLTISSSFSIVYNYSAELFPTAVRNTALGLGAMSARLSGTATPLIGLLDSLNPALPSTIFAIIALLSGFLMLFLPETLGEPMLQTIEEGERFKTDDTWFKSVCGSKKSAKEDTKEQMEPLKVV
uniref:Major facilitator superfamily (MFS) profile domain-containing protein n=2 Tax=Photinus pyralis TaxID=7054 RepID=A0A1Y1JSF9_PHOPY